MDIAGGNNWNLSTTEGDVKIGNDTYRLKIGVSLAGGGAGTARLHAFGGTCRVNLGSDGTDLLQIDATGVYPGSNGTIPLGKSGSLWKEVWIKGGTIQTSDARLKRDPPTSTTGWRRSWPCAR